MELPLLLLILFVQLVLQLVVAEAVPMEVLQEEPVVLVEAELEVNPQWLVHAEQLAKEMTEAMENILLLLLMEVVVAVEPLELDPMLLILVELVVLEVQVPMLVQLSLELLILAFMLVVAEALVMLLNLTVVEAQAAVELLEWPQLQVPVEAEVLAPMVLKESS